MFEQINLGAAEARSSVFKLATDVSNWWSTLDPKAAGEAASQSASSASGQVTYWLCTGIEMQRSSEELNMQ